MGRTLTAHKTELAERIVAEQWARQPALAGRYSAAGRAKCVQDVTYNLAYLAEALTANSPALFLAYVDWVKILFAGLHIPLAEIADSFIITREQLQQQFPALAPLSSHFLTLGLAQLDQALAEPPSFVDPTQPQGALARAYLAALLNGERAEGSRLIADALAQNVSLRDLYLQVFQPSLHEVGRLWQIHQVTVAQEHYFTAATQLIMSQLYPYLFRTPRNGRRLVAAGVGGELHEIGLRIVADFFELDGWDTYYLGTNLPAAGIVQTVLDRQADVLAISATMTCHIEQVADLVRQMRQAAPGRGLTILAGGYPFNIEPDLWRQVGADGSAPDAPQAVLTANRLLARAPRP